jgi:hypothetical protein
MRPSGGAVGAPSPTTTSSGAGIFSASTTAGGGTGVGRQGAGGGAGAEPLPLPALPALAPDFAASFPGSADAAAIKEAIVAEFLRDRYACTPEDFEAVVGSVVRSSPAVQSV